MCAARQWRAHGGERIAAFASNAKPAHLTARGTHAVEAKHTRQCGLRDCRAAGCAISCAEGAVRGIPVGGKLHSHRRWHNVRRSGRSYNSGLVR